MENLAFDPHFEQSVILPSAFVAKHSSSSITPLASLCAEWLYYESRGVRLRMVHRCAEWDGWEEGLVDSFLGTEEDEEAWFRDFEDEDEHKEAEDDPLPEPDLEVETDSKRRAPVSPVRSLKLPSHHPRNPLPGFPKRHLSFAAPSAGPGIVLAPLPVSLLDSTERAKEKMLDGTGDICGGRGGELGRRLEAWLCANGDERDD